MVNVVFVDWVIRIIKNQYKFMETKTNIYTKLLEFQKLGLSVKKDGKNPHFKSSFPTLNSVLDTVTEPLNNLGLVIVFSPEETGLRTLIVDTESGEKVESFMKYVGVTDAQKLLACNTYFRRGSLVALLGLSDEDDDGEKVIQVAPVKKTVIDPVKSWKDKLATLNTKEEISAFTAKVLGSEKMLQQYKDELQGLAEVKYKTL